MYYKKRDENSKPLWQRWTNEKRRLTAFVESEIGVRRETGNRAARAKGLWSHVTDLFYLRPALAAASLVIIAVAMWWWQPWAPEEIVLRGSTPAGDTQSLVVSAPQVLSEGEVFLEWTPMAGADSYQICFYDEGLNTIARLEPTVETALTVDRSTLPTDIPDVLIWRVVALQRGDEIGTSDPAFVQLP